MSCLLIGLTGGIGSGKSQALDFFKDLGITTIDADEIAKEVVQPNTVAWLAIKEHFGEQVLQPDQNIDRAALRKLVFDNPKEKSWLEGCLHPAIRTEMLGQAQQAQSIYAIMDIPLLAESSFDYGLQRVLVIDSPQELQIKRICARDNTTPAEALKIISTQASREQRNKIADDIIVNDKTLDNLRENVRKLHEKYVEIATK